MPDCNDTIDGICDEAANDTRYHTFDPLIFSDPINPITFAEEYEFDFENVQLITCYTATNAQHPENFHVELRRYDEGNFLPTCPRDAGNTLVSGTDTQLGGSFSRKNLDFLTPLDDYYIYSLSVYRDPTSTETPKIRVSCTAGVDFLDYPQDGDDDYLGPSLSDLAVVTNAISVTAYDASTSTRLIDDFNPSSRGPTALVGGPMKPDVAGPGGVENFTTYDWDVSFDSFFNGTSAAAAHAAGVVALMQSRRDQLGLPRLSPTAVRTQVKAAAVDKGSVGEDTIYGAGNLRVPAWVTTTPKMDDLAIDFGAFGIWELKNETTWKQINGNTAGAFATGDIDGIGKDAVIVNFAGAGVWAYKNDTSWAPLNGNQAESITTGDIDGNGKDDVVIDFGAFGIWVYKNDATWQQIHGLSPDSIVVCDIDGSGKDDVIADFGAAFGIWAYRNDGVAGWQKLHSVSPDSMTCGDLDGSGKDDVVISFGPGYGIWVYRNDLSWQQIHGATPPLMKVADIDGGGKDDLIINFGPGFGIWAYKNNSSWVQIHGLSPVTMSVGDYDGSGQDDLAIDFGSGLGVWVYKNNSAWVQRHGATTSGMESGNVDGL